MPGPVNFSGSKIELDGDLFTGAAAVKIKDNLGREVGGLVEFGRRIVVERLGARPVPPRSNRPGRQRTGFTERSIEAYHNRPDSLYGRVQVKAKLNRPGAKPTGNGVKAQNVPYIIVAVLESGRQGGRHIQKVNANLWTGRARRRRAWQAGERTRKPVWAFRYATRAMKAKAATIREALVLRGVN